MRFHIGCSFRLKNVLKFIIPILIGLCAYFGFNVLNVFADYIPNGMAYLNVPLDSIDFDTSIPNINKTLGEVVEEISSLAEENNRNYILIYTPLENGNFSLRIYVNSYNYSNTDMYMYTYDSYSNNTGAVSNNILNDYSNKFKFYYYRSLTTTGNNISYNSSCYEYTKEFLTTGRTNNLSLQQVINLYTFPYSRNGDILESTSVTSIYLKGNVNFKTYSTNVPYENTYPLTINNELISGDMYIPSYFDLMSTREPQFNLLNDRLPNIYFEIDTNNLSNFIGKFEYYPFIDAQTYTDIVAGGNRYFYGRKNNNNHYYSYERLDCTISTTFDIGNDNKITHNYSNINCSNNLSNYDRIYYTETFDYYYDQQHEYNHAVIGAVLTSNANHFISKDFKGHIYTKFNSNSGWKFLISSEIRESIYVRNSDIYMLFAFLSDKSTTEIQLDNNGRPIGNSAYKYIYPDFMTFTLFHNNVYIYDDYITRGNNNSTTQEMIIYFPEYRIISIPYLDSNNNEVFDYIDNTNNISSASINGNYNVDSDSEGSFDFSVIFTRINNFFDNINTDLVNTHNLIQQFFDSTPDVFKIIIEIIFSLTLMYLIFKEVKR